MKISVDNFSIGYNEGLYNNAYKVPTDSLMMIHYLTAGSWNCERKRILVELHHHMITITLLCFPALYHYINSSPFMCKCFPRYLIILQPCLNVPHIRILPSLQQSGQLPNIKPFLPSNAKVCSFYED